MLYNRGFKKGPATAFCLFAIAVSIALLPTSASATSCAVGSICFYNEGGTLTSTGGSTPTVSLGSGGSSLFEINFGGSSTNKLDGTGMITFTTGPLESGNLTQGGSFGAGGSFDITVNGSVVFAGSFTDGTNWTVSGLKVKTVNGKQQFTCAASTGCVYVLQGFVTGTYGPNGLPVVGSTVQQTFKSKTPFGTNGSLTLESGNTYLTTPEPSTLSLMGTGLISLAFLVKRRFGQSKSQL